MKVLGKLRRTIDRQLVDFPFASELIRDALLRDLRQRIASGRSGYERYANQPIESWSRDWLLTAIIRE